MGMSLRRILVSPPKLSCPLRFGEGAKEGAKGELGHYVPKRNPPKSKTPKMGYVTDPIALTHTQNSKLQTPN